MFANVAQQFLEHANMLQPARNLSQLSAIGISARNQRKPRAGQHADVDGLEPDCVLVWIERPAFLVCAVSEVRPLVHFQVVPGAMDRGKD